MGKIENKCRLKYCPGTLKFYDGALGYEAMVCQVCGSHYTGGLENYQININASQYNAVIKKYKNKRDN